MTHLPGGSPRMQPTGLLGGGPAQRSIRAQEAAQRSPAEEAEHDPSLAYPSNHSRYTMGSLALERDPEIAQLSLDHVYLGGKACQCKPYVCGTDAAAYELTSAGSLLDKKASSGGHSFRRTLTSLSWLL